MGRPVERRRPISLPHIGIGMFFQQRPQQRQVFALDRLDHYLLTSRCRDSACCDQGRHQDNPPRTPIRQAPSSNIASYGVVGVAMN